MSVCVCVCVCVCVGVCVCVCVCVCVSVFLDVSASEFVVCPPLLLPLFRGFYLSSWQ